MTRWLTLTVPAGPATSPNYPRPRECPECGNDMDGPRCECGYEREPYEAEEGDG